MNLCVGPRHGPAATRLREFQPESSRQFWAAKQIIASHSPRVASARASVPMVPFVQYPLNSHDRSRLTQTLVSAVSLLWLLNGCRAEEGPPLVRVQGTVRHQGQPLASGSISLRPDTSGVWHQPTGVIAADGHFEIYTDRRAGAPPGDYRVIIFANAPVMTSTGRASPGLPQSLIPRRYQDPATTPLRLKVGEDTARSPVDFEVTDDEPRR